MDVFIETERLRLRPITRDDVESLIALDSDPEVMRYLTGGKPTPRTLIETETLPRFLAGRDGGETRAWTALEKTTGAFLGWLALEPSTAGHADEAELGYRFRRSAWNKGYATEGSRALIDRGFGAVGLNRIFAHTMAVNLASRRVMEKAGLIFVRNFRLFWPEPIEGSELGEVEYALTRAEWAGRKRAVEGRL
jgi:RimJ/RimL family protein N-acetyltransferase